MNNATHDSNSTEPPSLGVEEMYLSYERPADLTLMISVFALFGFFCSSVMCAECVQRQRLGSAKVTTRYLIAISVSQMLRNATMMAGPFVAPKEMENVWGASGSFASCSAFGFLLYQASCMLLMYDISISLTYALSVTYSWTMRRLEKMERVVHPLILISTIGAAIAGIPFDAYNFSGGYCYTHPFPEYCIFDDDGSYECLRGGDEGAASVTMQAALHVLLVTTIAVSIWAVQSMYRFVRRQEARNMRYSFATAEMRSSNTRTPSTDLTASDDDEERGTTSGAVAKLCSCLCWRRHQADSTTVEERRLSSQVARNGIFYSGVLLIISMPAIAVTIAWLGFGAWSETTDFLSHVLDVLHGFFYLSYYMYSQTKGGSGMKTRYGQATFRIFSSVTRCVRRCCCCLRRGHQEDENSNEKNIDSPTSPHKSGITDDDMDSGDSAAMSEENQQAGSSGFSVNHDEEAVAEVGDPPATQHQ